MRPPSRLPASMTAATSATSRTEETSAAVGAVSPHPVNSCRSLCIHTHQEEAEPDGTEDLHQPVTGEHFLGRSTLAVVQQHGVPQHGHCPRDGRQLVPNGGVA